MKIIRFDLLSLYKIKYFMLFHIVFRISKETPDNDPIEKKL